MSFKAAKSLKAAKILALSLAASFPTDAAFAHAHLRQAVPAAGAKVKRSPAHLQLRFTEGVEARFSSIAVSGAGGATVPLGPLSVGGPDGTVVTVEITGALKPGTYTVDWRVTSVDSHKTRGSYRFTVEP